MSQYVIRVLEPHHHYPAEPVVIDTSALLVAGPFTWSAVELGNGELLDPSADGSVSEISWLSPEETRFFAAIALSDGHPRSNGLVVMHSVGWPEEVELTPDDLQSQVQFIARTREVAEALMSRQEGELHRKWLDIAPVARHFAPQVRRILAAIDPCSSLLHRGLYKFLMAAELRQHRKFLEESALAAFISREAALELLRRKLSLRSGRRCKVEEVFLRIESDFPTGKPFVEVLRSDWEARVLIAHPVNDVGEFWSPPVEADECYDALYTCVYLYRYLLIDEIWIPGAYD